NLTDKIVFLHSCHIHFSDLSIVKKQDDLLNEGIAFSTPYSTTCSFSSFERLNIEAFNYGFWHRFSTNNSFKDIIIKNCIIGIRLAKIDERYPINYNTESSIMDENSTCIHHYLVFENCSIEGNSNVDINSNLTPSITEIGFWGCLTSSTFISCTFKNIYRGNDKELNILSPKGTSGTGIYIEDGLNDNDGKNLSIKDLNTSYVERPMYYSDNIKFSTLNFSPNNIDETKNYNTFNINSTSSANFNILSNTICTDWTCKADKVDIGDVTTLTTVAKVVVLAINELKDIIDVNTNSIFINTSSISNLITSISIQTTSISDLTANVSTHSTSIATLNNNININTASISNLSNNLNINSASIANLTVLSTTLSNELATKADKVDIGDVTTLTTVAKVVVPAINEIKGIIDVNTNSITINTSSISNLTTTVGI
ncbi:MAG: hypothetical protein ACRC7R_09330, partial [Sarcina sp.]